MFYIRLTEKTFKETLNANFITRCSGIIIDFFMELVRFR